MEEDFVGFLTRLDFLNDAARASGDSIVEDDVEGDVQRSAS